MKLYKISGSSEYVDWDVLHNQQGYSTSATNPVAWKSSLENSWGETVANGYMEPTAASGWATKGFCLGKRGWRNMDDMANIYYVWPDVATSAKARHATWGESDVAVWDYDGTHTLYLVQKELEEGWMDEDTFAERGWEIVPDVPLGELIFVDASGAVVYSVESLNEMAFAPTGYFTIDDSDDVVFVEESPYPARGSLAKSYTPNVTVADGSGVDTGLPYYSQKLYIPVIVWHDENWNLGADYFGWDLSDSSGSVYATNNTGSSRIVISIIVAMIDSTDAEVVEVKNQSDAHFHAFKWTSGGVPYWYVVDGDEDWTDDLQADGYEEVPSVVLPTVAEITIYSNSSDHYFQSNVTNQTTLITSTYTYDLYLDQACTSPFVYDSSSLYLLGYLSSGTWKKSSVQTVADMPSSTTSDISSSISAQVLTSSGKLWLITNYTGALHDGGYQWSKVCKVCSSNLATVVTVYNSSNVAYNAFLYRAGGTDYYYVLDETQTDWTDDLSSIGYNIHIDIWFALKASQSNATFGANDYWGSFVIDNTDKSLLQNFGVTLTQVTVDGVTYDVVSFDNPSFSFDPIGLYAGIRTDPRTGVNINNFRCERGPDGNAVYHPQICIWSTDAYNVTCKTWLCRITKNS